MLFVFIVLDCDAETLAIQCHRSEIEYSVATFFRVGWHYSCNIGKYSAYNERVPRIPFLHLTEAIPLRHVTHRTLRRRAELSEFVRGVVARLEWENELWKAQTSRKIRTQR